MKARIFQKPKNAMQSGRAGTQRWMLEFAPAEARKADPLMGWAGSGDTRRQLRLGFASRDEALAYAARNGLEAEVVPTPARTLKIQAYAANFRCAVRRPSPAAPDCAGGRRNISSRSHERRGGKGGVRT